MNGKQVRCASPPASLAELRVYPLKSARALTPGAWPVDRLGLAWDRRWLIALPDGRALTQREEPRLTLLEPAISECLTISAPAMPALEVPLDAPSGAPRCRVLVLGAHLEAGLVSAAADAWVTRHLGYPARLVRLDEERVVDSAYAIRDSDRTAFTDGFPILLIGQASLDDLNTRLPRPLPMDRFRPNLVVAGASAYAEDGWSRIRVGELELAVVKPCARCVITTTDQRTAARGEEPLRTLASYRRTAAGKVLFGQNAIHLGTGTLRTGDVVSVLAPRSVPEFRPSTQIPPALP